VLQQLVLFSKSAIHTWYQSPYQFGLCHRAKHSDKSWRHSILSCVDTSPSIH